MDARAPHLGDAEALEHRSGRALTLVPLGEPAGSLMEILMRFSFSPIMRAAWCFSSFTGESNVTLVFTSFLSSTSAPFLTPTHSTEKGIVALAQNFYM